MRPISIKVRSRLPLVLWAVLLCGGLLLSWPADGEARSGLAALTPVAQPVSPLSVPRSAEAAAMPEVLARRAFGGRGDSLIDLAIDGAANRIYLTQGAGGGGHLFVLDADTLETIAELPVAGLLTLDQEHNRLYVAPGDGYWLDDEPIQVTVIDTQSLETVGVIPEASYIALDKGHGRIFAGNELPMRYGDPPLTEEELQAQGVRVYAADSLELMAESELRGIPVYDPLADKLLLVAYTASVVDPDTLTIERDLLPDLATQPFQWCNGCGRAWSASVHPEDGIVAVQMTKSSTSGPGFPPAPRFFDAQTLDAITDEGTQPTVQPTCGSGTLLMWPEGGKQYWQDGYYRTVVYRNLRVTDVSGDELAWRDGLGLRFIHPQLGYGITDTGYVIDLDRLTPIGRAPVFCTMAYDAGGGIIYGSDVNELIILADQGGEPMGAPPTEAEPLPDGAITKIVISPEYAEDHTLFVLMDDARFAGIDDSLLYRSTDGGQTWSRVQGGLPGGEDVTLDVVISPDYGTGRTLVAGGHTGEWLGHGVLRSTDGGETWQPHWKGLSSLRVYEVAISPKYAGDNSVWAYSDFTRLHPWQSGVALQRSTDGGLTWSSVMTASTAAELPSADELFQTDAASLPARVTEDGKHLEVADSNGEGWKAVDLKTADDEYLHAVMASPGYPEDQTLYVLGDWAIWRSQDDGATWSRWSTPYLTENRIEYRLTALAFAPGAQTGTHQMLVGTSTGELLMLTPVGSSPTVTGRSSVQEATEPASTLTTTVPVTTASPVGEPANVAESLSGEPPAGLYRPKGALATLWEAEPRTQEELGWAIVENSLPMGAAVQPFEHGSMIWRGDTGAIYVLYDDHTWEAHTDEFRDGEPEFDPALHAPQGLLQPTRGFGKLWRSNDDLREKLGWARAKEQGYQGYVHPFERGLLISSGTGIVVLTDDSAGSQAWR